MLTQTPAPNLTYLSPRPTRQLFTSRKIDYTYYGAIPAGIVLCIGLFLLCLVRSSSSCSRKCCSCHNGYKRLSSNSTSAPELVVYPDVSDVIEVKSMTLDPHTVPVFGNLLNNLPEGVGVFGGVSRKIFKLLIKVPACESHLRKEANEELELYLFILVKDSNPKAVADMRRQLDGITMHGLSVNAKKSMITNNFEDFFKSQDITQNEVLIFREISGAVTLFYSTKAKEDCLNGVIRPSIHSMSSPTSVNWFCTNTGESVLGPKKFTKALLHMLQGHGKIYNIPEATWRYYKSHPLDPVSLFSILKHFEKPPYFMEAYTQLLQLGLVPAGSKPNELWGDAIVAIHKKLAEHGMKFETKKVKLGDWEAWRQIKAKEMEQWKVARLSNKKRSFVECDEESSVHLPDCLIYFDQHANPYADQFFKHLGENREVEVILQQHSGHDLEYGLLRGSTEYSRLASDHFNTTFKNLCEKEKEVQESEDEGEEGASAYPDSLPLMYRLGFSCLDDPLAKSGVWRDDQLLPLESLADFQTMRSDQEEQDERELLHVLDPTIAQLPENQNANPHKKTALELALRLVSICRANKLVSLLVILCMFAFLALRIAVGYFQGQIVSELARFHQKELQPYLYATLALICVEFCVTFAWNYGIVAITTKFLTAFQINLFSHLVYQDLDFHEKIRTGEKMVKLSGDNLSMKSLISRIFPTFLSGLLLTLGSLAFAFVVNWQLSLLLTAFASVSGFVASGFGRFGRWKSREMRGFAGRMFRLSYESFANSKLMQNFSNEGHTISQYNKIVDDMQQCTKVVQLLKVAYTTFGHACNMLLRVALLWVGGILILGGDANIGDIFTALFIIHLCMTGIQQMYLSYGAFMLAIGSLERLFYMVNFTPKINRPNYFRILDPFEGRIEFAAVNFAYPSRRNHDILKSVSFSVEPGEILIISGPSSCGKSTILALALQFYRPGCGKILFDGIDAGLDPFWLRSQMGIMTSDYSTIFSTTIYQNLVFESTDSDQERLHTIEMVGMEKRVREVMMQVGLDSYVQSLPLGYNTILGDHGLPLSLAQRQKLLLARALLHVPKILLLDDPTRGLDLASECQFLQILNQTITTNNTTTIICCECPQKLTGILNGNVRVVYLLEGKIVHL